ncbi:MAG TPA: cytidylate kinase-like family protein [Gaiellaceae bacterium]
MTVRVVCISRESGAEGETIGRLVSERLGLQYVDEEVISRAAERGGVHADQLADSEQRKSRLLRVVEVLSDMGTGSGIVGAEPAPARTEREDLHRDLIRGVVEEIAGEGNAVIVAHAASMALAGQEGMLRVLVTASPQVRIRRLTESPGSEGDAQKLVKEDDAARALYFKRFYSIDRELPTHYDLVVNTDVLEPEQAAEIVVHAANVAGGPDWRPAISRPEAGDRP